mmetsp:Transcript_53544/g.148861  ORF Transcript_53544/g.148861 Transcript_53544/m.148861 type:complete len:201 (+) Transcript_53544:236-838(+)
MEPQCTNLRNRRSLRSFRSPWRWWIFEASSETASASGKRIPSTVALLGRNASLAAREPAGAETGRFGLDELSPNFVRCQLSRKTLSASLGSGSIRPSGPYLSTNSSSRLIRARFSTSFSKKSNSLAVMEPRPSASRKVYKLSNANAGVAIRAGKSMDSKKPSLCKPSQNSSAVIESDSLESIALKISVAPPTVLEHHWAK